MDDRNSKGKMSMSLTPNLSYTEQVSVSHRLGSGLGFGYTTVRVYFRRDPNNVPNSPVFTSLHETVGVSISITFPKSSETFYGRLRTQRPKRHTHRVSSHVTPICH